ncbi:MAG: hypothetical protein IRZ16_17145 [Myxococcaceae bacterium]|nr:hypothetical protein [Myxococcaceae bacterium]
MICKIVMAAVGAAALASGCVGVPHPDAADVERAQTRWPGTDQATLEAGRRLYVQKCSACHTLYPPGSHTPEQWPAIVAEMGAEAGIRPEDQALIEEFLVTISGRPNPSP